MKNLLKCGLALAAAFSLAACSGGSQSEDTTKIGIIQLAEHPALDQAYEGFMDGLKEAGYTEENTTFEYQNASNDLSNCDTIAQKLVNDGDDLIYAIATPAAQSVVNQTTEIPVIVSAVTDPAASGLLEDNEKPGGNVTGASDLTPVEEQIDLLQQLLPDAKKVAVMYCSSEDNSKIQAEMAEEALDAAGLEWQEATVADSSSIQQVTESLIGNVDAIYIPTDNLLAEGMSAVAQVSNANGIPCIVGESGMVENGGLATYGIDYYELGKLAAKQAVDILNGDATAAETPVAYLAAEDCVLTINKSVADELGIEIPEDLAKDAEMVETAS